MSESLDPDKISPKTLIPTHIGESLDPIKMLGCTIGIGGVFLYSIIDNIFPPKD